MIIDGYNIYCGAYAERLQMNEQKMISVEMNNLRGVSQQIKTESGTNICSKSVENFMKKLSYFSSIIKSEKL